MCEVSDKLQLCSCSKIDFNAARHYWIYHRLMKDNVIGLSIMGETVMPYMIDEKINLANRILLRHLLNEKTVFDKPIHAGEGDLLELSFLVEDKSGRITYGFRHHGGKWIDEEYDTFKWMESHKEKKRGKIKKATKNNLE